MKGRTVICFWMLIVLSPVALSCEGYINAGVAGVNDSSVRLKVPESLVAAQPAWTPADGEPIVSLSDALLLIRGWVKLEYGPNRDADFSRVLLHPQDDCSGQSYWFYVIYFGHLENGEPVKEFLDVAAVLLDGKVIPGEVEN